MTDNGWNCILVLIRPYSYLHRGNIQHISHTDCCVATLYLLIDLKYVNRHCKSCNESLTVVFHMECNFLPVWTSMWEEQAGCIAEAGPCLLFADCISGGARPKIQHPEMWWLINGQRSASRWNYTEACIINNNTLWVRCRVKELKDFKTSTALTLLSNNSLLPSMDGGKHEHIHV